MQDQDDVIVPHSTAPLVGRPRGAAWRALQADGVVWEGQVFLVGGDIDLAARMIVTHRRVAFARGGEVVLDIARPWLRPAPYLRRDGSVLLSIAPPGARYGEPPETVVLRMREGQPAAGHLVAMLAGSGARRVPADLDALEAIIRPALPDRTGAGRHGEAGVWSDEPPALAGGPPVRRDAVPPPAPFDLIAPVGFEAVNADPEPVVRQPSAPVASGRDRDWNLPVRDHLVPRGQRRSRWGWALRLTGLVGLLSTAAAVGAGRIPSPLETFGDDVQRPTATAPVATSGPALITARAAEQTAIALGVGGPDGGVEPTEPGLTSVGQSPVEVDTGPRPAPEGLAPTASAPAAIAPIVAVTAAAGDEGRAVAAQAATEAPSAETPAPASAETAAPEPTATVEPTVSPDPTATPEPTPTETPSPQPTATDAPPTRTPAPTAEPTAVPEPAAAAAPAENETPPPSAEPPTAAPSPELALAPRLAVGGRTLPAFGLPPSGDGNWLVVVVDVENEGDAPTELELDGFRLRAEDGSESELDPSADLVASIAGLEPTGGSGDRVTLDPGEAQRVLLLFQVDPAASGLELIAGETAVDLTETLAAGGDLGDLPDEPSAP